MAILTIDRATWRRGGDSAKRSRAQGPTCLRNDKGFMCCLGFDALAMGVPQELIIGVGEPNELTDSYGAEERLPHLYLESPRFLPQPRYEDQDQDRQDYYETQLIREAIAVNDDPALSDAEREERLRPILMQFGWEDVQFTGAYPPDPVRDDAE